MLFPDCKNALISGGRDIGVGVALGDGVGDSVGDGGTVVVAVIMGVDIGAVGLAGEQPIAVSTLTNNRDSQRTFLPAIITITPEIELNGLPPKVVLTTQLELPVF
jgi:hypothetical protein